MAEGGYIDDVAKRIKAVKEFQGRVDSTIKRLDAVIEKRIKRLDDAGARCGMSGSSGKKDHRP